MSHLVEMRDLGRTGVKVSLISFGCWGISGDWGGSINIEEISKILDTAWEAGINLFDTAAVYGNGLGESMLGNMAWRNKVLIATKVSAQQKPSRPLRPLREYYAKSYILEQVDASLHRLRRNYIDILQMHNWYSEWNQEADDVLTVFQELKSQGKIRAIGISVANMTGEKVKELFSKEIIDVVQVPFNLFQQQAMKAIIEPAIKSHVGVFIRSPLDHGSLAGLDERWKELPNTDFRRHEFAGDRMAQLETRTREICAAIGITKGDLPCYALAYCLAQAGISSVIVGMRTPAHVANNINTLNYTFTLDQIKKGKSFEWIRDW